MMIIRKVNEQVPLHGTCYKTHIEIEGPIDQLYGVRGDTILAHELGHWVLGHAHVNLYFGGLSWKECQELAQQEENKAEVDAWVIAVWLLTLSSRKVDWDIVFQSMDSYRKETS